MGLRNLRKQHAVGQGFFHSAELSTNGKPQFRYVYDCGAMTKYAGARSERIKAYLRFAGARSKLDLLFISHVHADHLNGLPQLLHATTGLDVETIVLPYFDMIERLIGYARDAAKDPAVMRDDFYRNFVLDPVAALSGFEPRQILFVRSAGDEGPGAADVGGGPEEPGPETAGRRILEERLTWKLVGRGPVHVRGQDGAPAAASETLVATVPDSMGMAVPSPGTTAGFWLLSPFIDPAIERQRGVFKAALLKALNHGKPRKDQIKKADFDDWLDDPANLKNLVLNKVADLREAYAAVEKNLNISSMCLYSGPPPDGQERARWHIGKFGRWTASGDGDIAWLATGDADLKVKKKAPYRLPSPFYGALLDEVVTLTLPHHGSEGNFDAELLAKVEPNFCVAAADAYGKWRHPGTKVVQAIASQGRFLSVVTSQATSEVTELVGID